MKFLKSPLGNILIIVVILIACFIGYKIYGNVQEQNEHEEKVESEVSPVFDAMNDRIEEGKANPDAGYDLEETMRIINGMDMAIEKSGNFKEYLLYLAKQDYSRVAPDVIEARRDLLEILTRLYAKQSELEHQESLWLITQDISSIALNTVGTLAGATQLGAGDATEIGAKGVQESFEEIKEREEITGAIKKDIGKIEDELIEYMFEYSNVYYKYLEEWDRVCVHRDMAYLAINGGDIEAAKESINKVMELNPNDKEATLLLALAAIEERDYMYDFGEEYREDPIAILDKYIDEHPDETAPAFLLKGVYYGKIGNFGRAKLNLEEAAVYYPKQSEALIDMLNPYESRAYLKKSREGNYIVDLYKSTMLGSGYFSPDLQLARQYFDLGDFENGKEKVLDHFSRRRNQAQWDNILADIQFCKALMENDFNQIFPEDSYLNLGADVATFGDKINVSVENKSDVRLTNVSLILCLQFTDMHREDYATFKMENSLPALEPNSKNDFGKMEIKYKLFGEKKTYEDVVSYKAVLISNEAITWVDTDEFKQYTVEESKELTPTKDPEAKSYLSSLGMDKIDFKNAIVQNAQVAIDENLIGSDKVNIKLPRVLALLKPAFRMLDENGDPLNPDKNFIVNDDIDLSFKSNLAKDGDDIKIQMFSKYLNATVTFDGDIESGYKLADIELE